MPLLRKQPAILVKENNENKSDGTTQGHKEKNEMNQ